MSITVMKQALEALENLQGLCSEEGNFIEQLTIWTPEAMYALRTAIEQAEKQEPVAWTEREKELIDGMIEVQLDHARRCDNIANRTMAEKQKNWDMERVTLLQKIKATPPAAQRQWVGLTDEEMHECWGDPLTPLGMKHARMIEAKLREKNT